MRNKNAFLCLYTLERCSCQPFPSLEIEKSLLFRDKWKELLSSHTNILDVNRCLQGPDMSLCP